MQHLYFSCWATPFVRSLGMGVLYDLLVPPAVATLNEVGDENFNSKDLIFGYSFTDVFGKGVLGIAATPDTLFMNFSIVLE